MRVQNIVVVFGVMAAFTSAGAHAGLEAQYRPLLKEINVAMCTIQDDKSSNKAKARAQQKMMTINNQLAPIKMKLSSNPSAYQKFINAERKAVTNCKVASVSASDYKPLLKQMRRNTCALMSGGSTEQAAKAAAALDEVKNKLEPIERSLKAGNKNTYNAYRKQRRHAEMGIGC